MCFLKIDVMGINSFWAGAKYGGYGSFLPTYQRSPSIWSHPKTPRRVQDNNRAMSPVPMEVNGEFYFVFIINWWKKCKNDLFVSSGSPIIFEYINMQGCPQINKAPLNAHLSAKPGATSSHGPSSYISGIPSGNISVKQDSSLPSAPVTEMSPPKFGTSNKSVNPTGQRMPKFRIKVCSATAEKRNAEIYTGLGLDNSPLSSLGNSLDESGGMPLKSQETLQESPTSILQVKFLSESAYLIFLSIIDFSNDLWMLISVVFVVDQIMTSFAVPEDVLLSPLHDSFVCLIRKKKFPRNSQSLPALEGSQECCVPSSDEAAMLLVDEEVLKENKTKLVGESELQAEVKHGSGMDFKNGMIFPLKEIAEHRFPEDMVLTGDIGDFGKVTDRSTEIFREANKDILKERESFSDLDKEESLESITGQNSATSVQQNVESSLEKTRECGVACSSKDVSADHREDGCYYGNKLLAQFRADSDMFRGKENTNIGEMDRGRITMSCKKEKPLWEGKKKLKGAQIRAESAPYLAEEGLRIGFCSEPKDKHNLMSQKDIEEVKNNPRELLRDRKSELMDDQIDTLKRAGERTMISDYKDVEKKGSAFVNLKGTPSGKRVANQCASEASLQVALNPPFANNRFTTKMVPAVVIEENWVCCDRCQKWRLLPFGKKPEDLPEKWLCSMLSWL